MPRDARAHARGGKADSLRLFEWMDQDGDGTLSPADVVDFSVEFDGDHSATHTSAANALGFAVPGARRPGSGVSREEWIESPLAAATAAPAGDANGTAPQQVHLSLGSTVPGSATGTMVVMWVTMSPTTSPAVQLSATRAGVAATTLVPATVQHGTAGNWTGYIYTAVLRGLAFREAYSYTVGSPAARSAAFRFTMPPQAGSGSASYPEGRPLRLFMFGDHGVFPLGFATTDGMARDWAAAGGDGSYDAVVLAGDVSYAGGVVHGIPELEAVWDMYGRMIEPLAARMPWQTTVGNHENQYDYDAFTKRYRMGAGGSGNGNFWFSFDVGAVHFASLSSEHPYEAGSPQWQWLEADLAAASGSDWRVVVIHRPFYSSDLNGYHNASGRLVYDWAAIRENIEPLLRRYDVQMTLTGHLHGYERCRPISSNGTVVAPGAGSTVHVVQGNAGAWINEQWMQPSPPWSAVRSLRYGYATMEANATALRYRAVDISGAVVDDFEVTR